MNIFDPSEGNLAMRIGRRQFMSMAAGMAGASLIPEYVGATMPQDLALLSACEMVAGYAAGHLSPVEVTMAVLARIDRLNPKVGAFFFIDRDGAMTAARESEARWQAGKTLGPIDGVPISIKDFIAVVGMPSPECLPLPGAGDLDGADAPYVARLRAAGAILTGKTAQPQNMLMGSGGSVCSTYGSARNPWSLDRSAGGSSAGAGAAAAAGMGPLHLGADGGGSIRIPASYCGMAGYKHSRGFLALPGLPGNNCIGPVAHRLEDVALMMAVLAEQPFDRSAATRPADLSGLRIGICPWVGDRALRPVPVVARQVDGVVERLRKRSYRIGHVEPFVPDGFWLALTRGFLGANGQYYRKSFEEAGILDALGPITLTGLNTSSRVPPDVFKRDAAAFPEILKRMADPFAAFDIILTATMPTTAPTIDRDWPTEVMPDPLLGIGTDHLVQTAIFNFTGHPAVTINCGFDAQGLPIGLQIAGRMGSDVALLSAAAAIERLLGGPPSLPEL